MIKHLHLERWRSIKELDLEFGPIQILIGPNASGKSNIVDALSLLSEALDADLETAISRRGGPEAVLFQGAPAETIGLALDYFVPDPTVPQSRSDMTYSLQIGTTDGRPGAAEEELRDKRARGERGRKKIWFRGEWGRGQALRDPEQGVMEPFDTGDPGVLALKALGFLEAFARIRVLREFVQRWHFLSVDLGAVRDPRRDERATRLDPDAGNLANVLRTLAVTKADGLDRILERLGDLLTRMRSVDTSVEHGLVILQMEEDPFGEAFEAPSISDGTLRLLAILTALETMPDHGLLCVEEPEHGLHPLVFGPLMDVVREYCPPDGTRQVLLTTHSADLIDAAEPHEVRVVDKDEHGATRVKALDQPQLKRWLQDFRLGELWRMRQLGGVPS